MSKTDIKTCSACGTGLINHRLSFALNLLEETLGKYGNVFFSFVVKKKPQKFTAWAEKVIFSLFSILKIARFNTDIEHATTGRSKLIWEEAKRRSISMEQVVLWGKYLEYYRARIEGKIFYFQSLPIPPTLPQEGYKWLDDKSILFEKFSVEKIPIPTTKKVSTWNNALSAFRMMTKPVIVKPNLGSRGRHTTTNIKTEKELKDAFDLVKKITPSMVIQEHLSGSVCRATTINEELVGFFRADPPQVIGDGIHSIKELVFQKNKARPERLSEIVINEDVISFIDKLGYTPENILEKDKVVNLSAKTGRMYGGYTEEMLWKVHPTMHSIFKKAGELVQAPVVGFDLIIENPTQDPDLSHWGIIECNSLPFIDLHYFALEGPAINLAENIWDLWNIPKV
ncbi:MAG: hypothetical protein Q8O46_01650 [bacterium]|nr:hypothetical protein [bacterium]